VRGVTFPILTDRLLLRPFEPTDLDALHDMQSRDDVTRYLYWQPRTREETEEALRRIVEMRAVDDESDGLRLAAIRRDTGALVGDLSLWRTSREHQQGEIGFVVHPDHQGRGFATEGSVVMLRLGFEVARFHRIEASCDARNLASARVMERLGMRREAHFIENELVKGEWTDGLVYSILASEWEAREGRPGFAPLRGLRGT
jgi:RimJ/RimL family protein N-acetyltransferase